MGGIVGWLASLAMKRDGSMGVVLNVLVGIVGSFIGNSLLSFLLGGGTIGAWPPQWSGVIGAFVGAALLLGIVNLIQRGRLR
jgi:uncharacterized membrane protein YeaQ/YmgE (transglycosylase-associated protein family)